MARVPTPAVDPAEEAAALLRRLGFATLVLLVPATALVARRAVVILVPVGILLMVLATVIEAGGLPLGRTLKRMLRSRGGLAGALLLLWCTLSLLWTPFVGPASERLFNIITTVALVVAGAVSLPERMRSANLYLIPVGTLAAAMAGITIALGTTGRGGFDEDGGSLDRGLTVLTLFLWPSLAWLRSRGRDFEALALALAAGSAVALGPTRAPFAALIVGGLVYAAVQWRPGPAVRALATGIAGLVALAPLIPFLAAPLLAVVLPDGHPFVASLETWRAIILSEPIRLVTGNGFETALRARVLGLLPASTPATVLFEVWYELGVVGAAAAAIALYDGVQAAARNHASLVPGLMAAFAAAFAFACLGIGTALGWWFTSLAAVVLIFVATQRGQFRTTRPKAHMREVEEA